LKDLVNDTQKRQADRAHLLCKEWKLCWLVATLAGAWVYLFKS